MQVRRSLNITANCWDCRVRISWTQKNKYGVWINGAIMSLCKTKQNILFSRIYWLFKQNLSGAKALRWFLPWQSQEGKRTAANIKSCLFNSKGKRRPPRYCHSMFLWPTWAHDVRWDGYSMINIESLGTSYHGVSFLVIRKIKLLASSKHNWEELYCLLSGTMVCIWNNSLLGAKILGERDFQNGLLGGITWGQNVLGN